MRDQAVLSACLSSRAAYDKIKTYVDEKEFSPQGQVWWPLVDQWYSKDKDASSVDSTLLRDRGKRQFDPRHQEGLLDWFDGLPTSPSPDNAAEELLAIKREHQGLVLCSEIQSPKATPAKLLPMLDDYAELCKASALGTSEAKVASIEDTFDVMDESNKIPLHPKRMNEKCGGGAVAGDFIIVFARPEAGKTLLSVNMACGFARDSKKVLYIGNEESISKTYMRMLCNLTNRPESVVLENKDRAVSLAKEKGIDNITAIHLTPGSTAEIEQLIKEHKPQVLIVDQIRNLEGKGSLTEKLETNAKELRAIIGRHEVVGVFVTQAGDRTERYGQEPPIWLTLADIDSSRTGLPAAADLIIGLGVNNDMKATGHRALSFPKNKLGNYHGHLTVQVEESLSKVR